MFHASIVVSNLGPSVGQTHYAHAHPGNEIEFKIKVEMRDDLPDLEVKCGVMQAVMFPRKGPMSRYQMKEIALTRVRAW